MEIGTIIKFILILGGCIIIPILGTYMGKSLKNHPKIGIAFMFLGSLVALAGFYKCSSWNCLCCACGECSTFCIYLIAWLAFLFVSFTVYCMIVPQKACNSLQKRVFLI